MNISLIILLVMGLIACSSSRRTINGMYDSSYIQTDSTRLKITKDTLNGTTDSIRYYKSHVFVQRDPKWRKIRGGWWYITFVTVVTILFLIVKSK